MNTGVVWERPQTTDTSVSRKVRAKLGHHRQYFERTEGFDILEEETYWIQPNTSYYKPVKPVLLDGMQNLREY